MAAVPSDIASSQAEALGAPAPSSPTTKPKKPKAVATDAANNERGAGPIAEPVVTATDTAVAVKEQAHTAVPAPKAGTPADGKKKKTTPWFVDRTERTLRNRANQSFPILIKSVTLKSHHAQDILERTGKQWSEAMITLSETMRNFKPEDQCVEVDAAVDRLLDESFGHIRTNIARLDKLAEAQGLEVDEMETQYSKPSSYKLQVLSPREFRFHTLLQELDKMCDLIDKMWYFTLVTDRNRSQIPYEAKRQIIRMVNRVRTLVYRAQASSQRAGAPDAADPRVGTILDPNAAKTGAQATNDGSPEDTGEAAAAQEQAVAEAA
jgi:hypothetical protein